MLLSAGLPKSLWGETMSTSGYLINRCPSTAINLKTPMEMWNGKPPDYSYLKVFGCLAYVHIKQDNLDARDMKCVFIGYPTGVKGYKLWCLEKGHAKCLISRDVVFDESTMANLQTYTSQTKAADVKGTTQVEVELLSKTEAHHNNEDHDLQDNNHATEENDPPFEPVQNGYNLVRDRAMRQIKPPDRYGHADMVAYAFTIAEDNEEDTEPSSYKEVLKRKDQTKWEKAMDEKMDSLMKNKTWRLVQKPEDKNVVGCRWIYKKKEGIPGV